MAGIMCQREPEDPSDVGKDSKTGSDSIVLGKHLKQPFPWST